MKKNLFVIITIIVVGILVYFFRNSYKNTPLTTPTAPLVSSDSTEVLTFCLPADLTTTLESEGAAGSLYVTLTIQNSSVKQCQIQATNLIEVVVNGDPNNIKFQMMPQPEKEVILLQPQQKAYAQLRFPNGPQCTKTVTKDAQIKYFVSPHNGLTFTTTTKEDLKIQVCTSQKEVTTVDMWPWTNHPINQ